tara:strand:- start:387 stop:1076 length:690 start_codon:yes stop_codon:yes gene_type:complete
MDINFKDKVVLVTGSSRGIGKQIKNDFQELGATCIEHDSSICDLTNIKDIEAYGDYLQLEYDRIDVLVNNAGINKIDYIQSIKYQDLDSILKVNLYAPFILSQYVSAIMASNSYGRIVNISSIWGTKTKEKRTSYTMSKSGINGLTKSLSVELARDNILVNSVSPGFTNTELTKSILSTEDMKELSSQVPMKRFAEVEEISKVVMFLCSDWNTYLTGQDIKVDGGFINV